MVTATERKFIKLCVAKLGDAVGSTREEGQRLGLSVDDTRKIWKQILEVTANGGGKYVSAR